jgi:hypothetical protein
MPSGALVYRCLHDSCKDRTWQEYRGVREPGYAARQEIFNDPSILDKHDPLQSARKILVECFGHSDYPRLLYSGNVFYEHNVAAYQEAEPADHTGAIQREAKARFRPSAEECG